MQAWAAILQAACSNAPNATSPSPPPSPYSPCLFPPSLSPHLPPPLTPPDNVHFVVLLRLTIPSACTADYFRSQRLERTRAPSNRPRGPHLLQQLLRTFHLSITVRMSLTQHKARTAARHTQAHPYALVPLAVAT